MPDGGLAYSVPNGSVHYDNCIHRNYKTETKKRGRVRTADNQTAIRVHLLSPSFFFFVCAKEKEKEERNNSGLSALTERIQ